jgi:hypothetical protein
VGFCGFGGDLVKKERRRHDRIDFSLPIEVEGYEDAQMIKNFSPHGLLVQTEAASDFNIGDEISLTIKLPLEKSPIQVKPRIAHITSNAIGVEFVNIVPQHAMALEHCFHIFKHTIPQPTA